MVASKWERWAAATGVLAIALLIAGALVSWGEPSGDSSDHKIVSWVTDNSNQIRMFIGAALIGLGGIAFLWFFGTLRARLARSEGEPARLAGIAFGGGIVCVTLLYAGITASLIVPAEAAFTDKFKPDPNTARLFLDAPFFLVAGAMLGAAAVACATSLVALRTRALPRWLAWYGFVAAAGGLLFVPLYGVTGILVGLWVIATSVVLWRQTAPEQAPQAMTAPT